VTMGSSPYLIVAWAVRIRCAGIEVGRHPVVAALSAAVVDG